MAVSPPLECLFIWGNPRRQFRRLSRILEVLAEHGELRSSEIRDCAEIPDGSMHYQLLMLDSWDLITPVRTQYVGEYENEIPATVYTLTEKG